MQFFTTASLFAAAVASAAVMPRQETYTVFDVTNFSAECLSHGGACIYSFNVVQHNNGEFIPTECDNSVRGDGVLPALSNGQCKDSSRTFNVTKNADGTYTLSVTQPVTPSSDEEGSHTITADQIELNEDDQQVYVGPKNFTLQSAPSTISK
ncbi:hypothetical protein T440DRAFT_421987 [Plenodomus tracheiphilus IPT5]|uniref:Hypersensitive response-inducing protein n=1 Tax=Plenodomus tracheiphilus IPT5 TaxID=1408161 RepID=A0A6A7B9F9_9PLEO|nr:hypothetical protein T440DRAFT_421987 [Plenodomus tracheiphilus IPT5]